MTDWPEFVSESTRLREPHRPAARSRGRTGWEEVIFEVEDDQGSDDSTAAEAP